MGSLICQKCKNGILRFKGWCEDYEVNDSSIVFCDNCKKEFLGENNGVRGS